MVDQRCFSAAFKLLEKADTSNKQLKRPETIRTLNDHLQTFPNSRFKNKRPGGECSIEHFRLNGFDRTSFDYAAISLIAFVIEPKFDIHAKSLILFGKQ